MRRSGVRPLCWSPSFLFGVGRSLSLSETSSSPPRQAVSFGSLSPGCHWRVSTVRLKSLVACSLSGFVCLEKPVCLFSLYSRDAAGSWSRSGVVWVRDTVSTQSLFRQPVYSASLVIEATPSHPSMSERFSYPQSVQGMWCFYEAARTATCGPAPPPGSRRPQVTLPDLSVMFLPFALRVLRCRVVWWFAWASRFSTSASPLDLSASKRSCLHLCEVPEELIELITTVKKKERDASDSFLQSASSYGHHICTGGPMPASSSPPTSPLRSACTTRD